MLGGIEYKPYSRKKRMRKHLGIVAVGLLSWVIAGCSTTEEEVADQQTDIKSCLTSEGIAYEQVATGVFRYIANANRTDYASSEVLSSGDQISLLFEGCEFDDSEESGFGDLFYTNREELLDEDSGLNTTYWDFNPLEVTLGGSSLIVGLEYGLIGAKSGDSIEVWMSSDYGYGDNLNGTITENTPLAWRLVVQKLDN